MVWMFYRFQPKYKPLLTVNVAGQILEAKGKDSVNVSLDLGLSITEVKFSGNTILLPNRERLKVDKLLGLRDERAIYVVEEGEVKPVQLFQDGHFYKLVNIDDKTPTLEVDGIHMHRVSEVKPWEDARVKVSYARVRPGMKVLDVCTGLGYTVAWELRMGAKEVLTVEKSEAVLRIAEYNPWSRCLSDKRVRVVLGDAFTYIKKLPDESFHRIIHDPPRFSLAGELYSLEFYKELHRVLKPGGILVHYTGTPRFKTRVSSVVKGVLKRVRMAGFTAKYLDEVKAVLCLKPKLP